MLEEAARLMADNDVEVWMPDLLNAHFLPELKSSVRKIPASDIVEIIDAGMDEEGKTVYLVDARFDDSEKFLKQVQAWFGEHMPGVNTVFKPMSSVYTQDDPATWEEIKAKGDAAIVAAGH